MSALHTEYQGTGRLYYAILSLLVSHNAHSHQLDEDIMMLTPCSHCIVKADHAIVHMRCFAYAMPIMALVARWADGEGY